MMGGQMMNGWNWAVRVGESDAPTRGHAPDELAAWEQSLDSALAQLPRHQGPAVLSIEADEAVVGDAVAATRRAVFYPATDADDRFDEDATRAGAQLLLQEITLELG
jgi:hypothetical protein